MQSEIWCYKFSRGSGGSVVNSPSGVRGEAPEAKAFIGFTYSHKSFKSGLKYYMVDQFCT